MPPPSAVRRSRPGRAWLWVPLLLSTTAPTCMGPELRILSYNVLHGQPCAGGSLGAEVLPRMELAVQGGPGGEAGLIALAPDIVGLQEVSQVFVDETIAENQACSVLDALPPPAGGVPAGVTSIDSFEHAGDTLARRMNGVRGARLVEIGQGDSRDPPDASPYAMRFVRDNPRILPLIPGVPLPPDDQEASDVAAEQANLEIGLAVISRLRIQRVTVHNLGPDQMPGGTRALLHASIVDHDGRAYDFFNSHLTTGGGDTVPTMAQALDIISFIQANRRHADRVGFFVCDCNAEPDTAAYAAFVAAGFIDSYAVANPSADGFTSGRDGLSDDCFESTDKRIDYVFAIPDEMGGTPTVLSSQVVLDYSEEVDPGSCRFPSDHNGVLSTFRVTL